MRGVVFDESGLVVATDLSTRDLRAGEVRVRIEAAGVCHSDVSVIDGTIPFPTPVVLGHEGAGVVTEIGEGVTGLQLGDHVVISTLSNCGACAACDSGRPTHCRESIGKMSAPFRQGDRKVLQFANIGAFAEETIVKGRQCVPISKEVSFEVASLLGCGVITGVGAVFNRAKVTHGQSVVVIGVGGIGLNVIQGCALADALPIIAVDTNPKKGELAKQFGATHFIDASQVDTAEAVKEICPNGVDVSFECVGHPALIRQAIDLLDWGGTCVILGVPKFGTEAAFQVSTLYNDKTIMGCRYGAGRPHKDIPLFVELYLAGRLKLDELVTRTYPLEDVQRTIDDMHHGELARGVLTF
ncbi:Zn-dependent alcohol dehydrogenase [Rhabdothermincola sediminis]|uniref:Zn-dependent alcohol dehydrogenase n=1 Tax=Rhabdothermincola sediminis TaxID=2751370 RepID=UPI001AA09CC8|nr:Zn-dependent alcohol dehydrogenase [Rhabdothermincola sediminis]